MKNKIIYTLFVLCLVKIYYIADKNLKFSQQFGINYKILKLHNPWLRESHLNNKSRKEYSIKIPKEGFYSTP